VRLSLVTCLLLTFFSSAYAQEQENKLVSRLLKPDMSMQNTEQNKTFTADRADINKRANVSTFYLQQKSNDKRFSNTPDFATHDMKSGPFDTHRNTALLSSRSTLATSAYSTSPAKKSPELRDGHKKVNGEGFAGNRPYLERGKSQKSLERQNPPLTIEQVRELLNKNK
jgi:hypothetical protein